MDTVRPQLHGAPTEAPLCVDLDGTLLRSDLLVESLLRVLAHAPWLLFLIPFWLLRGKANLKRELARRCTIDPATLPYDPRVLDMLAAEAGRRRVLCTASDRTLVEPIAAHLGCFDEVIATDSERNLSGSNKAQALVERFGERGFIYAGNAPVDLAVWSRAAAAVVVNAGTGLARAARDKCPVLAHLPGQGGRGKAWIKAIRLHQWLKNLLVFVPLATSHTLLEGPALFDAVAAFVAFGMCASGVYLLNDLLDLPVDRQHPRKRSRPFASGALPALHGLLASPALTLGGLLLAWWVEPRFAAVLLGYYVLTLAYSLQLKRVVMLDVISLAALYTIRIIGGTVAIGVPLSFWLLAFSMFIFLSLALLKRYTELTAMLEAGKSTAAGRGYTVEDLPLLQSLGAAAGYLSVLVLALYIHSPESMALYKEPRLLWLLCPILLYWVSRAWVVAHRGRMDDDPVVFAATDRTSQGVAVACAVVVALAI